jgi:hypothetical protein
VLASHEYCSSGNVCLPGQNGGQICMPPGQRGDSCLSDLDCSGKYLCNQARGPGRCAAAQTTGGGCARDADCASGFCNPIFAPAVCTDWQSVIEGGTCGADVHCGLGLSCNNAYEAKAAIGFCPGCVASGQCQPGLAGKKCVDSEDCDAPLSCNQGAQEPTCIALKSLKKGSACNFTEQCEEGFVCNKNVTPQACDFPGIIGSICTVAQDCESGLVCSQGFDPPQCSDGAAGALCQDDPDCVGSLCNIAMLPPQCVPAESGKEGELCAANVHCEASIVCNTALEKCLPPGDQGIACQLDEHCAESLYCVVPPPAANGECRAPGDAGALCTALVHCESGLLCSGGYLPNQCGTGQNGEPCCHAGDCSGGLACLDLNGSSENCGGASCVPDACHCESP